MLENVIKNCPDNLWFGSDENRTIWKRVFHVLESIDYWLDDFEEYSFPLKFPIYTAEMDQTNPSALPKNELSDYSNAIQSRLEYFFDNLSSSMLAQQSIQHPKVTYLDIILSQIRHIHINIGYCNEKLNSIGFEGTGWIGYGEE